MALGSVRCRRLPRPSYASGLRQRRRGQEEVASVQGRGTRSHCAGAGSASGSGSRMLLRAPSVFPLGPVGGARQRPERKGDGSWSFVFPSVPDHGRSARNLQSSVPSAVDCRWPVLGAGLGLWGERRESRLYTGCYKTGFTEPRVPRKHGINTGCMLLFCIQIWELESTLKTNAARLRIKPPTPMCP